MFFKTLSRLFQFAENVNVGEFPRVNYSGTALKFRKRNKNPSLLVYLLHSWQFEIKHFHVVVGKQIKNSLFTWRRRWSRVKWYALDKMPWFLTKNKFLRGDVTRRLSWKECCVARGFTNCCCLLCIKIRLLKGHLHDDDILLSQPESFRVSLTSFRK